MILKTKPVLLLTDLVLLPALIFDYYQNYLVFVYWRKFWSCSFKYPLALKYKSQMQVVFVLAELHYFSLLPLKEIIQFWYSFKTCASDPKLLHLKQTDIAEGFQLFPLGKALKYLYSCFPCQEMQRYPYPVFVSSQEVVMARLCTLMQIWTMGEPATATLSITSHCVLKASRSPSWRCGASGTLWMVDVTIINQLVFQLSKLNSNTGAKLEHPFCEAQCSEWCIWIQAGCLLFFLFKTGQGEVMYLVNCLSLYL